MARDDRFKGAFYQGRERPSLMNRIGGALMGFGEGYAGRGQQFIAARRAEQEKEQNDLMRASISDAKQVLRQLGNIPPADGRVIKRKRARHKRDYVAQGQTANW